MNQVTLGADPELFIQTHDGRMKSIIGLLGGTKTNPMIIDDNGLFKVQEDNVAAEYNIPPSGTRESFIQNILWPQRAIAAILGTDKFQLCKLASASFPEDELHHEKAKEFGCDPDLNAWSLQYNPKPECNDKTFRTAGGHVHIGMDDRNPQEVIRIIRAMDKHLGVWSVLVDTDDQRRKLYGKAGAFRPQPHGCEYRSLSNFWIFDEALIGEVWDRTQAAVNHDMIETDSGEAAMLQHIINTGDKATARSYLKTHRLL